MWTSLSASWSLLKSLIAYCSTVISSVRTAQPLTCFLVYRDTFSIAPISGEIKLVSPVGKHPDGVRRESHSFHRNTVRQPLVVKPGRVHRLLNREPVINHSHQDIRNRGDNARTSRRAQHHEQLPVLHDNRRRHRR